MYEAVPRIIPSEVQDLGFPVGRDLDVARLQIPVDDTAAMRGLQSLGDLAAQVERLVHRKWPRLEHLGQGLPGNQLQRKKAHAVRLLQAMNRGDVGVAQGGKEFRFPLEAGQALGVLGEVLGEHLDGDLPVKLGVERLPDHPHAPLADLLDEPVVGERLSRLEGHGVWLGRRLVI
jgi:hypothetical protein